MKHLPARPDADQCTLSRGSLTHPNDPSTQQPIHTRASSNHRMGACEARAQRPCVSIHVYDLTCSPAPRDSARQSSRRPRGRGRVHESGHLQHGDAVAPPVRLPVGGRGVFVGWGLQEQQERLAARPQVGQRRQGEHGGFRRHPSQSRHRGTWDATALGAVVCLSWL